MCSKRWLITLWLVSIAVAGSPSPVLAEEPLYLGLKQAELFSRCGIEVKRQSGFGAYQFGDPVTVYAAGSAYEVYRDGLTLAVYPSVEEARRTMERRRWNIATGPTPLPGGDPIGDEMNWGCRLEGPDGPGAAIGFRRRNVVLTLGSRGEPSEVVALARQIDALIRDDRQIAPLGTFDPPPEIVDAGIPATLTVRPMVRRMLNERPLPFVEPARSVLRINPQFRGLGPPEKIRLSVTIEGLGTNQVGQDGLSREHVAVPEGDHSTMREKSAENDGRFLVELHRLPSEATTRKVTLVAASEDNVIVTKEVQVQIVPAD